MSFRETREKMLKILEEEIVEASGCTEPVAIAYVANKLVNVLGRIPTKLDIYLSGAMLKNTKNVIIPNSRGRKGPKVAAVMGLLFTKRVVGKGFMLLSELDTRRLFEVDDFISANSIDVHQENSESNLYIRIEGITTDGIRASVEVKYFHTNITKITLNDVVIVDTIDPKNSSNYFYEGRDILSIENIYNFSKSVTMERIRPLFRDIMEKNTLVAEVGLDGQFGISVGKTLRDYYGNSNAFVRASTLAAAGCDARMNGCELPVMTTSGSGNQGLTASLPIISYGSDLEFSEDNIIRALLFSHLTTIHLKTKIGRLSGYCGVVSAGAGVSGAIAFLNNESLKVVTGAITNTLGNLSGMFCDGAKSSCAIKINSTVMTAFDSYILAKNNKILPANEGIIGENIEETISYIGEIASRGMKNTDDIIQEIIAKVA